MLDKEKDAKLLEAQGVRLKSSGVIIHSFITQAGLNPKLGLSVCHISLSFSTEDKDKLSSEFLVKVTKEYMQKMGIADTQYIVARHIDKEHPHVHLCFNRVDNRGKTICDKNDRIRSVKICRELTEKYGLHIARGKEKVKEHRLKELDKTRYEIYHALKDAIPQCRNWDQLQGRLKEHGIETRFKHKGQTDEVQGVVFTKNNYSFNGSKVDRTFSYSKIDKQLRGNNISNAQTQAQLNANQTGQEQSAGVIGSILDGLSGMSVFQPHGEDYEDNQFRKRLDYEEKKRQRKKKGIRR
ncbi:relaxase/mobilization nuclease domain-containing protein [Dysgonomonas sp. Marseille-P4677]|uniref:relaxase/mobilization nuclease domain-containing protein n=1 Tax=Dysgonomonas sp. Marseille-P4677 TaxID=2364790 RepID=UPI00351C5B3F